MSKTIAVMGLSGGMDSSTLLACLLSQGYEVHACVFNYGSKHNKYENLAAGKILNHYDGVGYPIKGHYFDITSLMADFKSALLKTGEAIPEGHYNDESMKKTVVPGRNLIFASIMAGLAESLGAQKIVLGVHAGDHHIYPDCRPDFIDALDHTVKLSSDQKVSAHAPFLFMGKRGILQTGFALPEPVPYHLTRTCYKDQELSCGKCGSCQERLEAFAQLGIKDPVDYE